MTQPQMSQPANPESSVSMDSSEINKEFTEINQQLGRLNLQYTDAYDPNQQKQPQQQQQPTPTHHQYDHQMAAPSYDQGYDSINHSSLQDDSHSQQQNQQQQVPQEGYDQHQQQQQPSYPYGFDGSTGQPGMFVPAQVPGQDSQQPGPYDYWGANAEVSLELLLTPLTFRPLRSGTSV